MPDLRNAIARAIFLSEDYTGDPPPAECRWDEVDERICKSLADAALAAIEAAGFVVAPQFATPRMIHKGRAAMFGRLDAGEAEGIWRAMVLAARPRDASPDPETGR